MLFFTSGLVAFHYEIFLDLDEFEGEYNGLIKKFNRRLFNLKNEKSKKISRSIVQVFVNGQKKLLAKFSVPKNKSSNCWHVLKSDKKHKVMSVD